MGRYKFPGKPSKNVNKKRVSVLSHTTKRNDTSLNQKEFLNKQKTKKLDSSTSQVNLSDHSVQSAAHKLNCLLSVERRIDRISSLSKSAIYGTSEKKKAVQENYNSGEFENLSVLMRSTKPNTILFKKYSVKTGKISKLKTKINMDELSSFRFSPITPKNNLSSIVPRVPEKESISLVGKFVLPTKSIYSSRVIKPNKRFINNEQLCTINNIDYLPQNRKRKGGEKAICLKQNKIAYDLPCESINENTVSNTTDNICNESDSNLANKDNPYSISSSENEKESNDMVVIDSTTCNSRSFGKIILREAKLQLHTKTKSSKSMEGPFSDACASTTPGTVSCEVCGAVRFYKFVKQARKFNIYCCESCRKFISKMIKRQTYSKNCALTVNCLAGQGMCYVPPIVRSQKWKVLRCSYKARCPACWLKMCIQSFQMPSQLKINLVNMLPESMRNLDLLECTTSPKQINNTTECPIVKKTTDNQIHISTKSAPETIANTSNGSVKCNNLFSKTDALLNNIEAHISQKLRPKSTSQSKHNVVTSNTDFYSNTEGSTKRNKLDIKGPRVKHVCRSASIALGQPLATIENVYHTNKNDRSEHFGDSVDNVNCTLELGQSVAIQDNSENLNLTISPQILNKPTKLTKCHNSFKPSISILSDYFDNYDTDDKIYNDGYGLVGSEPFTIQAVCFYCGSAGKEQLLYCTFCCEPFHCYCVNENILHRYFNNNPESPTNNVVNASTNCKFLWKCPSCSVCYQCGKTADKKFFCVLCQRHFHPNCMQKHDSFPVVCSSCAHCQDCGSCDVTDLLSNFLLCLNCLKSRVQDNHCSVCEQEDATLKMKMFKCSSCNSLVHLSCEQVSNEMHYFMYGISSSISCVCSKCSNEKLKTLKQDIHAAIKNSFHIILRLFIRNSAVRELLNCDELKNRLCSCIVESTTYIKHSNDNLLLKKYNYDKPNKYNRQNNINKYSNKAKLQNKDSNLRTSLRNLNREIKMNYIAKIKNKSVVQDSEFKVQNYQDVISDQNRHCKKHGLFPVVLLLNIKDKINSNIYRTLEEFYYDVKNAINEAFSNELLDIFNNIVRDIFPWHDPEKYEFKGLFKNHFYTVDDKNCEYIPYSQDNTYRSLNPNTCEKNSSESDTRMCVLCSKARDGIAFLEGRLLYCGQNEWIHINCAFWSSDVYEELDCSLQNVRETIVCSRLRQCSVCKKKGATLRCSTSTCNQIFHYMCSRLNNCKFFADRVIYCPSHSKTIDSNLNTMNSHDFIIHRPVYIDIDIQTQKKIELNKVQFLIGSLNVTSLGTFLPSISDNETIIIPSEFVCTRLFWSTLEPWKIIRYTINTSVSTSFLQNNEQEKSFTVDHSLSIDDIKQNNAEISKWSYQQECERFYTNKSVNITDDDKIVIQVVEYLIDNICNKESKEICNNDVPNTVDILSSDILSSELKEEIFEDLPGDLLDDISMQDIFSKLINYEDSQYVEYLDTRNDSINKNSKNNIGVEKLKVIRTDQVSKNNKISDPIVDKNDYWPKSRYKFQNLKQFCQNRHVSSKNTSNQLKYNDSGDDYIDNKNLLRIINKKSCSLSWSCKYEHAGPPKRKKSTSELNKGSGDLFTLADETNAKGNSQKLRFSDSVLMTRSHSTLDSLCDRTFILDDDSFHSYPFQFTSQESEKDKENKCRTFRNTSPRIVQTDGADDSSSDSEHLDTDLDTEVETQVFSNNDNPVKCHKCECTYRTLSSYQKHLNTCEYIFSNESDSDCSTESECIKTDSNPFVTDVNICSNNFNYEKNINSDVITEENSPIISTTSDLDLKKPLEVECVVIGKISEPQVIKNVEPEINNMPSSLMTMLTSSVTQQNTVPPFTKITNLFSKIPTTKAQKPVKQKITSVRNQRQKNLLSQTKNHKIEKVTSTVPNFIIQPNNAFKLPDYNAISASSSVIVQNLSSPNLIPAYVEAFQQQTGQNLECLGTFVPNEFNSMFFVNQNTTLLPDEFQSNNCINIQNGGFSVLSETVETVLPQSTTIGSIFNQQNNTLSNYECGMISTGQTVLNSSPIPTIDSSFSSQLMYYGNGTMVQNMISSQQFISSTNYSMTSTQVFESETIKPVINLNGTGCMLFDPVLPQPTESLSINPVQSIPQNILISQSSMIESNINLMPVPMITPCETVYVIVEPMVPLTQAPPAITTLQQETTKIAINNATQSNILSVETVQNNFKNITVPRTITPAIACKPQYNVQPSKSVSTSVHAPTQVAKPVNRVSPMQIENQILGHSEIKDKKHNDDVFIIKSEEHLKIQSIDKIKDVLEKEINSLSPEKLNKATDHLLNLETKSLKLLIHKQNKDDLYDFENKYFSQNTIPIDIVPLKQNTNKPTNRLQTFANVIKKSPIAKPNSKKIIEISQMIYKAYSEHGFEFSSSSRTELWKTIFEAVQTARYAYNMVPLPDNVLSEINGLKLLGLNSAGLRYLIEQLPGVSNCINFKSEVFEEKEGYREDIETKESTRTTGAARCEMYNFSKKPYDMFSWLASKHRTPTYVDQTAFDFNSRRTSSVNLPMAMRFRQLKATSKTAVGVYRSKIHGRGLFCLRDIEFGEMVIEYAGEVIRSALTDKREKFYNSKGIGCYMFRVDDLFVIDATMRGNAARFINHSCDPNCYSRVIDILGHKHILIFALRKIRQGEELTYDYKFPFEEDKIPCTCGAKRCRKYLN